MKKSLCIVALFSVLSMGFVACSEKEDSDTQGKTATTEAKANGETCSKNEDCKSNYCNDEKKCAIKASTEQKKADGETCSKNEDCESNYCNDVKKCAVKTSTEQKKADGETCAINGDCNSNYCDDNQKCAAAPQSFFDDCTDNPDKFKCSDLAKDLSADNKRYPECEELLTTAALCKWDNRSKLPYEIEEICEDKISEARSCTITKYPEVVYVAEMNRYCEAYDDLEEEGMYDNSADCITGEQKSFNKTKEKYSKCLTEFIDYSICEWNSLFDEFNHCLEEFLDNYTCLKSEYNLKENFASCNDSDECFGTCTSEKICEGDVNPLDSAADKICMFNDLSDEQCGEMTTLYKNEVITYPKCYGDIDSYYYCKYHEIHSGKTESEADAACKDNLDSTKTCKLENYEDKYLYSSMEAYCTAIPNVPDGKYIDFMSCRSAESQNNSEMKTNYPNCFSSFVAHRLCWYEKDLTGSNSECEALLTAIRTCGRLNNYQDLILYTP